MFIFLSTLIFLHFCIAVISIWHQSKQAVWCTMKKWGYKFWLQVKVSSTSENSHSCLNFQIIISKRKSNSNSWQFLNLLRLHYRWVKNQCFRVLLYLPHQGWYEEWPITLWFIHLKSVSWIFVTSKLENRKNEKTCAAFTPTPDQVPCCLTQRTIPFPDNSPSVITYHCLPNYLEHDDGDFTSLWNTGF